MDWYHGNNETYGLLKALISPKKITEVSFEEILLFLDSHFNLKPNVIVERFHFYRRNQKG
ncbi:hypothetical protein T11_1388 [Trichinella zimbabwensis]|uniref:Uncharacterized protein n=1 Tax=Trichinella zimbabwensis TaxID=268475 RepID=A0A0V1IBN2_9BILA|nr:hypothetical protein T11_1388 [Trichinella zimbabwensis]